MNPINNIFLQLPTTVFQCIFSYLGPTRMTPAKAIDLNLCEINKQIEELRNVIKDLHACSVAGKFLYAKVTHSTYNSLEPRKLLLQQLKTEKAKIKLFIKTYHGKCDPNFVVNGNAYAYLVILCHSYQNQQSYIGIEETSKNIELILHNYVPEINDSYRLPIYQAIYLDSVPLEVIEWFMKKETESLTKFQKKEIVYPDNVTKEYMYQILVSQTTSHQADERLHKIKQLCDLYNYEM